MRQACILVVALGAIVAPALAVPHGLGYSGGMANWTRLDANPPGNNNSGEYYAGSGGEFTLQSFDMGGGTPSLTLSLTDYSTSTRNQDGGTSFQTFCMERDELPGVSPLSIWVSEEDAAGSGYGSGTHAWMGGVDTNTGDDLDPRTAYLYYKFATGSLAGYNYTDILADGADADNFRRAHTAAILQQVIWYFEGEVSSLSDTSSNINLAAFDSVLGGATQLANQWIAAATSAAWTNAGPVRVLQLSGQDGSQRQDMLYLVTEICDLTVTAAVNQSQVPAGGAMVTFTYVITNNAPQPLTNVTVVDAFGPVPGAPTMIGAGATITLTRMQFVVPPLTNTVTVVSGLSGTCTATASVTVEMEPPQQFEGCTPGYWKNHTSAWQGYTTGQDFDTIFGVNAFHPNITLLAALRQGGGGVKALGRHATAALLSAAHGGVYYPMTPDEVIDLVQDALAPGGDIEGTKNLFDAANNAFCPL